MSLHLLVPGAASSFHVSIFSPSANAMEEGGFVESNSSHIGNESEGRSKSGRLGDRVTLSEQAAALQKKIVPGEEPIRSDGREAKDATLNKTKDTEKAVAEAQNKAEKKAEKKAEPFGELSPEEKKMVVELKARDAEVRAHERAHLGAAGSYAQGGPKYDYQTGPDGQRYAVGGEVSIDVSSIPGDPEATIQKAAVVRRAALAPGKPSGQDQRVAAKASQMAAKARVQMQAQKANPEAADGASAPEVGMDSAAAFVAGADHGAGVDVKESAPGEAGLGMHNEEAGKGNGSNHKAKEEPGARIAGRKAVQRYQQMGEYTPEAPVTRFQRVA